MGGHDNLTLSAPFHAAQEPQEQDLPGRRKRRFRFIKDEDPLAVATLGEKAQKTFPM
jgi:hypothetical protein